MGHSPSFSSHNIYVYLQPLGIYIYIYANVYDIKGIFKYLHVYSDIVQIYTITSMNTKVIVQKFPTCRYQIQKSNNPQEQYKRH